MEQKKMNEQAVLDKCQKCHYESLCNVPQEKRIECKVDVVKTEENLIFGYTWEAIERKQQRK